MEMERYSRHFNLPGFDRDTQKKLSEKSVAVIGAGGLGTPVLQYLVAAGVGEVNIIDHDVISLSNLQRQVLFNEEQIGLLKAETAKKTLQKLNGQVKINSINLKVTNKSISELLSVSLDLIIDASDNFETRYLVDDYSRTHAIPLIYGAIHQFEGQVSVFNHNNGVSYKDLFPLAPEKGVVDNCDINGVLGPVAGMIGNLMANEGLKILTGIGKVLDNELLVIRFDDFSSIKMKIPKKKVNIEINAEPKKIYQSISADHLKETINKQEALLLVDVRSNEEFLYRNIEGSVNIPATEILNRVEELPKDGKVIMICNIGQKSMNVIRYLQNELKIENLINLDGGVYSFFDDI